MLTGKNPVHVNHWVQNYVVPDVVDEGFGQTSSSESQSQTSKEMVLWIQLS